MTSNQIAYWNLVETRRSNLAKEGETHRSNLASETETRRSNRAREQETSRHNTVTEGLTSLQLSESQRANLAREAEDRTWHDMQMRSNILRNLMSSNIANPYNVTGSIYLEEPRYDGNLGQLVTDVGKEVVDSVKGPAKDVFDSVQSGTQSAIDGAYNILDNTLSAPKNFVKDLWNKYINKPSRPKMKFGH